MNQFSESHSKSSFFNTLSVKYIKSPHSPPAGADSIRYAHLDMAAMATAQRVGAERVQGREDRLTQLESRWRGPPN